MILQVPITMVAGWLQRHQRQVITDLIQENRVLKAHLGGRQLHLTDTERRRLAALAYPLRRQRLKDVATIATPDTLLRWYTRLIAQKFDGSEPRRQDGRPRVAERSNSSLYARPRKTPVGVTDGSGAHWRIWGIASTRLRCAIFCVAIRWIPRRSDDRVGWAGRNF